MIITKGLTNLFSGFDTFSHIKTHKYKLYISSNDIIFNQTENTVKYPVVTISSFYLFSMFVALREN